MSETVEQPQGEPAADPSLTPTPSPESTPAPETDAPEQTEEEKQQQAQAKEDRRIAQLRARLGAAEREQARQAAELDFYRRQAAAQAPTEDTPEQAAMRQRAEVRAEVEAQIRTERFHEQGASEFGDWKQRCDDLVKMGADSGFAQLLVEMPDGVKVAGALAADPEAVERIANLRSERARAVALGKYAATLEGDNGHARGAPAPVTRAPAPVRPVTGRAAPTFNEYTADPNQLVDRYMKQAMERQIRR